MFCKVDSFSKFPSWSKPSLFKFFFSCILIVMSQYFGKLFHFLKKLKLFTEAVSQRSSVKKAFLEIRQNSQENTCARVSLLKMRLWRRCFPVNFKKFLRTSFLTEHLRWLLLYLPEQNHVIKFVDVFYSRTKMKLCLEKNNFLKNGSTTMEILE